MRSIKHLNRYVGIMIHPTVGAVPFAERAFFSRLSLAGARIGVKVYVFSPEWIDWNARTVRAFFYNHVSGTWNRRSAPLPSLIYDRSFFRTREQFRRHQAQVSRLLKVPGVKLLGLGLRGKWDVYQMLKTDETTASALPRTELYEGRASVLAWLKESGTFIMKPHGGTHGKGVIRVSREAPGIYEVSGRDGRNLSFRRRFSAARDLFQWIDRVVVRGRTYLMQQYLTLTIEEGIPFDIRTLVQKSGEGLWKITGMAVRLGQQGTLTSNLHGGGTAAEAVPFLLRQYGEEMAASIVEEIGKQALAIPPVLEQNHGPLLELGIDFGVDRLGRVWVLEVNSKPGRSSFTRQSDKSVRISAVINPIRYARYVLDRQLGGHKR